MFQILIFGTMKHYILLFIMTLLLCNCKQQPQDKPTKKPQLEKLASGFFWAEGPAADSKGNVYFTDVPKSNIFVWTVDQKLDTFRVNSGGANGLYFTKADDLLICEMYTGRVTKTTKTGEQQVLANTYNGKGFNQPNDLWPDGKGGIYFTDPKYGPDANMLSQDGYHVYYIKPDASVIRVTEDIEKPNGIIGTPDGNTLYVVDNQTNKTYKFSINADGTLANKTLFANTGTDGMTLDNKGNVYITTKDNTVAIYSPEGKLLETIQLPERVANVAFGGKNNDQLFITANTSLYRIQSKYNGVK